jgi:hypothetical protein
MAIMEKQRLPQDFDWVSARTKCSALNVFQQLKQEAQQNTETLRAAARERGDPQSVEFIDQGSGSFLVMGRIFAGEIGVRFILAQDEISAEGHRVAVNLTATLTLSDDGECRLSVGSEHLDRWQFLKRALEPLFFRTAR